MVEVTQADRDAAASGYYAWIGPNPRIPEKMVDGNADDHSLVQAFARHREAALTTAQAEAEAQEQRIAELEAENARLRETLGTICKDSNPDWTEKRAYPECVLDDIHEMAVKAYYELKS